MQKLYKASYMWETRKGYVTEVFCHISCRPEITEHDIKEWWENIYLVANGIPSGYGYGRIRNLESVSSCSEDLQLIEYGSRGTLNA